MKARPRLLPAFATSLAVGLLALPPAAAAESVPPLAGVAALGAGVVEEFPTPQDGTFRMTGGGWGHGRGMSQWGAYQAAAEGVSHEQILAFYYPGTTLQAAAEPSVRVLLASDTGRTLVVRAVPGLTATFPKKRGVKVKRLGTRHRRCGAEVTLWRARARARGISIDAYCGRWRRVVKPTWMSPGATVAFQVPGELVGTKNRAVRTGYRGAVVASRLSTRALRVVNVLPMEQYLRSVLTAEVSPSWPTEALRAQAVAARTFAAHEMLGRVGQAFDVYDSVRSQAYPGAAVHDSRWQVVRWREDPRTDAAIAETAGVQVTRDGGPVLTQFSSSNGGASARTGLSHMVAQVDPWDSRAEPNPRRSWSARITTTELARRCPAAGSIQALQVLGREGVGQWGGRITSLRVAGSAGQCTLTGDWAIRQGLGVYSSYLTFSS